MSRTPLFPASDHFPLGRAYGCVQATPCPASGVRPFGLTLAVAPSAVRFDPGELGYDDIRQVGLIRDGREMVPLARHTDGQTNTLTNADGHGGYDSDTDWRED
ncbi:MAG: putative ATP-grasp-modified RiPP [Pseudonocardiales bacterium]|nr:putative ATP-grasp-modified RiPP [Pseudonocardiales bacterium]